MYSTFNSMGARICSRLSSLISSLIETPARLKFVTQFHIVARPRVSVNFLRPERRLCYTTHMSAAEMRISGSAPNPRPGYTLPGPSFWIAGGLLAILSAVFACTPLFNLLGYEFSAAISALVSLTAGPVAIGVVRRRPAVMSSGTRPGSVAVALCLRAIAHNLVTLVVPLAIILLNALRVTNCNLALGLLFYLLLPVATSVVCSIWGTAVGLGVRWRFAGGTAYALVWLAVASYNAWEFWRGPQMDSYNQIVGWLAGPIFEEVIEPGGALIWSRIFGLAWALAFLSIVTAFFDPNLNRSRPGVFFRYRRVVYFSVALVIVGLGLKLCDTRLGFGRSLSAVEAVLSEVALTPHFAIHHSPGLTREETRLLVEDHEFRFRQIAAVLGRQDLPRINSYVFPSASSKRGLTGAGRTQFAKPWQFAMFLNAAPFPHPVLKHELVHVLAGGFGSWPFRASARVFFWQNVGLIEGLAVAVDWPAEKYDPHTWSAALKKADLAPDINSLFDPLGFWTKASQRSYTLAGSFVRYLLDHYEFIMFRQAYGAGTLDKIFGKPAKRLIEEWRAFLDGGELDPGIVDIARLRFERPSIFSRKCAHEISALRSTVAVAFGKKDYERARSVLERLLSHLPGDPTGLQALAEVCVQQKNFPEAIRYLEDLVGREDLPRTRRIAIGGRLGDALFLAGRGAESSRHWKAVLDAHLDDGSDRLAAVKIAALDRGEAGAKVLSFLEAGKLDIAGLLDLREAAALAPGWGATWYLIGRQLFNQGMFERCIPYLERAGEQGLSHPALAAENMRLLISACYRLGKLKKAAAMLAVLAQLPRHPGELLRTRDWLSRVAFDNSAPENRGTQNPR